MFVVDSDVSKFLYLIVSIPDLCTLTYFVDIVCICSDQVHVFESVSSRCLCQHGVIHVMVGGVDDPTYEKISLIMFPIFKATNHASAQVLMEFKSTLRW